MLTTEERCNNCASPSFTTPRECRGAVITAKGVNLGRPTVSSWIGPWAFKGPAQVAVVQQHRCVGLPPTGGVKAGGSDPTPGLTG